MVAQSLEFIDEVVEHRVLGDRRHILHGDKIGNCGFDQPSKMVEQTPTGASNDIIAVSVGGKWLTGSAPGEHSYFGVAE
jgi:hypothetical protein